MPLDVAQSSTTVNSESDWDTNATLPGRASRCAREAFSPMTGLMKPRQFGPRMRRPKGLAASAMARYWTRRSSRVKRKRPLESTAAPSAPRCPSALT